MITYNFKLPQLQLAMTCFAVALLLLAGFVTVVPSGAYAQSTSSTTSIAMSDTIRAAILKDPRSAILTEAGLSFLGFGVPPTIVTWGSVLNDARGNISAWWLAVFPGLAIFLTVFSYNLIGEAMRDALDPKLRKRD